MESQIEGGVERNFHSTFKEWKIKNAIELKNKLDFLKSDILSKKIQEIDPWSTDSFTQNQQGRKDLFNQYEYKENVEDFLVETCQSDINNDLVLKILFLTGRESDMSFVKEMEDKYHDIDFLELRNLILVFDYTYDLYSIKNKIQSFSNESGNNNEKIETFKEEIIGEIKKILLKVKEVGQIKTKVTHVTSLKNHEKIIEEGKIHASTDDAFHNERADGGVYQFQWEGDGIYAGIFGSYRDWLKEEGKNSTKTFAGEMFLKEGLPAITHPKDPRIMFNILSEGLKIDDEGGYSFGGMRQWKNESNYQYVDEEELRIQQDILLKVFDVDVHIVKEDELGQPCIVLDDSKKIDPIEWASVAKILNIRRLIPKSSLTENRKAEK